MVTRWVVPWRLALVLVLISVCFCEESKKSTDSKDSKDKDEKPTEKPKEESTATTKKPNVLSNADLGPCEPGENRNGKNCYYTKLLGIGFSEGTLKKVGDKQKMKKLNLDLHSFDKNWLDYELSIKSGQSKQLLVTPMLDVHKYNLLHKPQLIWNGKDMTYSPIENIEFPLDLEKDDQGKKSAGSLDRHTKLKVQDPKDKGGGLFGGGNSHEYNIRVVQAPDVESIVTADAMDVWGCNAQGQACGNAEGKYKKSSPHHEFRFIVGEDVKTVKVKLTCGHEATGLKYNGADYKPGSEYTSAEFEGATKSILGQCLYKDDTYTSGQEMQRTYVITVARTAEITGTMVDLRMWPPSGRGGCVRAQDPEPITKNGKKHKEYGWRCMKAPPDAQFVGSYDNPKAELVVHNHKTGGRYRLWNGIPTSIPVPMNETNDDLLLEAGRNKISYTFLFGPPPSCTTFHWKESERMTKPENFSLGIDGMDYWQDPHEPWRKYQDTPNKSWKCPWKKDADAPNMRVPQEVRNRDRYDPKAYCNWEPCQQPVDDTCCEPVRPPCHTYDQSGGEMVCDKGLTFHLNHKCLQYPCRISDTGACCAPVKRGGATPCLSMQCPVDKVLSRSAASRQCQAHTCQATDIGMCCEQRAICNTMKCPHGFSVKYNAALYLCKGYECKITDAPTCCDASSYCTDMTCPGPSGVISKSGNVQFSTPLGWSLKADAAAIPCGGSPCIEWDTGVCCNQVGKCSTLTCPTGWYPKDGVETIACDTGYGGRPCDDATDYTKCCDRAERCDQSFVCVERYHSGVTIEGYGVKKTASSTYCPGPRCTQKDRNLCCDMTDPFKAAQYITLESQDGEGKCTMQDGPQSWICKAKKEIVHLMVNLTFDQPVGNKVFIQGLQLQGTAAHVNLPAIAVAGVNNPTHVSLPAVVAGVGAMDMRLQIWIQKSDDLKNKEGAELAKEKSKEKVDDEQAEEAIIQQMDQTCEQKNEALRAKAKQGGTPDLEDCDKDKKQKETAFEKTEQDKIASEYGPTGSKTLAAAETLAKEEQKAAAAAAAAAAGKTDIKEDDEDKKKDSSSSDTKEDSKEDENEKSDSSSSDTKKDNSTADDNDSSTSREDEEKENDSSTAKDTEREKEKKEVKDNSAIEEKALRKLQSLIV